MERQKTQNNQHDTGGAKSKFKESKAETPNTELSS